MTPSDSTSKIAVAKVADLKDRQPAAALVANVDLVIVRFDDQVRAFYGRCMHRGAMMADGHVDGHNLICGVHGWDYRLDTGVSEYNNDEALPRFRCWIDGASVFVDEAEIAAWHEKHPQPYDRDAYLGQYADPNGTADEPHNKTIQKMARGGIKAIGSHGPVSAMGVSRTQLPTWDDIQILTAQMAKKPLLDGVNVGTKTIIGPSAKKPLELEIPLFVSDMSFGAISAEAKVAMATGAELAGTSIASGEGGALPEERAANSRYMYELASGKFGWDINNLEGIKAFHFKGGQGAKTGTGGHLPGHKVTEKIASVRGLKPGQDAISPATFSDLKNPQDFADIAADVRRVTGGVPIGFKLSAQHVEADIDFALAAGADYIILDGRGGGTGAAPNLFKDNISIPTIPALARARRHLDAVGSDASLVATGGLRTPADFVKALALGADAVAVANSALQAIGCLGMRACHTNNCPVGIATQKPDLRSRLIVEASAQRLHNWFEATVALMKVLARACGHDHLGRFELDDLVTFDRDLHHLAGLRYAGVNP